MFTTLLRQNHPGMLWVGGLMKESNTSTTAAKTQLVLKGAHCLRSCIIKGTGQCWKDMRNEGDSNLGLEVIKIQLMIIIFRSHDEFMIIVVLVAAEPGGAGDIAPC